MRAMRIAGKSTDAHWRSLKRRLSRRPTARLWDAAFRRFFYSRIETRYLRPIAAIDRNDRALGEGFAIASLFCTLLEFLESCEMGKTYRYVRRGDPPLGPHEYSDSRKCFQTFLLRRKPF